MNAEPKIPVTPEMVLAARQVLWDSGILSYEMPGPDDLVVEEMLRAALRVGNLHPECFDNGR